MQARNHTQLHPAATPCSALQHRHAGRHTYTLDISQQHPGASKAHTATHLAAAPCSSTSTQAPKRPQAPLPIAEVRTNKLTSKPTNIATLMVQRVDPPLLSLSVKVSSASQSRTEPSSSRSRGMALRGGLRTRNEGRHGTGYLGGEYWNAPLKIECSKHVTVLKCLEQGSKPDSHIDSGYLSTSTHLC